MNRLYIAAAVTFALIVSLTAWESIYSDRFTGTSITAEQFDKLFANLPLEIGPWQGENHRVDDKTLEVAGAVNHVSRTYRNVDTGQQVDLWLVVGHARDICRHTPDVCYPNHGFSQDGSKQKYRVETEHGESIFYTARFRQEMSLRGGGPFQRVFWAWNANADDEHDWNAPDSPRLHYGNNRALYKMYFTGGMKDRDEPVADNVALDFAKVMLPAVNHALFPQYYGAPAGVAANTEEQKDAAASQEAADIAAKANQPAALPNAETPTEAPIDAADEADTTVTP